MATINSVLGPIETADLGFTLSHEHVLETGAGIPQVYPEFIDRDESMERAKGTLKEVYGEGVRTIVDVTTMDLGRDVRFLEQVSQASGVNIICATGWYLYIPRAFELSTPDVIAPLFIREIQEGIEDTRIKAGIIKVASGGGGVTSPEEIILQAAARAQLATGVPITTHSPSYPGAERVGEQQLRILGDEGVELSRVCVGHCDDSSEMDYLLELLETGAWLGLDWFREFIPQGDWPDWEERAETVHKLLEAGFGHKVLLSHDWSVTAPGFVSEEVRRRNPDGFLFISRKVLPMLREMGVSEDTISQVMVDNPRRFFEGH
jgi:phosphotriesterase-related protein